MGIEALFCCFRNLGPKITAITGIGASVTSFAFLVWALADVWIEKKGPHVIFLFSFILVILDIVEFVLLLIFLCINERKVINILGRIICIAIIIMSFIAFVFLIISWIYIIDYYNYSNQYGRIYENIIPIHEWAALFIPFTITLLLLPVMALAANFLYNEFKDKIKQNPTPIIIPNISQPEINLYLNGPIPPLGNNVTFPVFIQQSELNINK